MDKNIFKNDGESIIPGFFAGRSIFITGGTGFLGKVLIEKLIRSCPDVNEIFLLMRPKKGASIDNRLRAMLELPLFDTVRETNPKQFDKLIPVSGDVAAEGLGLPPLERRVITERVSVIFHVAANVRFDDPLQHAIFVNLRSTRDVCILAGGMKNLAALVHVSSTYAHTDRPDIEEIPYPTDIDWKKAIKIAETVDDHILRTLTAKFIGTMPNTYTFTKKLAEQVIVDYSKDLPCVIFRPSIVISTVREPVKGWVDNFNGPVGLMVGGGKGILRAAFADGSMISDYIPVDVAIKAMLICAWKRGLKTVTSDPSTHVYNCASYDVKNITLQELSNLGLSFNKEMPLQGAVWYPNVTLTTNRTLYFILVVFFHVIPAFFFDILLKLSGQRAMLLKLQRKIYISNSALSYFLRNSWNFKNRKLLNLLEEIPKGDVDTFGFEYHSFDIHDYFKNCSIGTKKYLLKEDMSKADDAKKHFNRMMWIDRIVKVWFTLLVLWLLNYTGVLAYLVNAITWTAYGSVFDEL